MVQRLAISRTTIASQKLPEKVLRIRSHDICQTGILCIAIPVLNLGTPSVFFEWVNAGTLVEWVELGSLYLVLKLSTTGSTSQVLQ